MAKRFTDTEKWKKPFIRTMKAPYKLLWLYILDECDHAGIWQIDIEVAEIKIGEKLKLSEALNQFGDRVVEIGDKLFLPDFISFQYGNILNPDNRVHKSVIDILEPLNLLDENLRIKDLTSHLQGAKDKDKDKEKDMDKEKDKKEPTKKKNMAHLFSDSKFYDYTLFEAEFIGTDYEHCNLRIYYEKVKNWSASGNNAKTDWIATARNFMLGDMEKGKLILKDGKQSNTQKGDTGSSIDELLKGRYTS